MVNQFRLAAKKVLKGFSRSGLFALNHHPHSLRDPQPIVDFILQHSIRK
jgi:hypothetical protein